MPRKRYKPEEIVAKLRQVDVLVSQGQSMGDAIRQIGVGEPNDRHRRAAIRTMHFCLHEPKSVTYTCREARRRDGG
jgi:hypothetical protein